MDFRSRLEKLINDLDCPLNDVVFMANKKWEINSVGGAFLNHEQVNLFFSEFVNENELIMYKKNSKIYIPDQDQLVPYELITPKSDEGTNKMKYKIYRYTKAESDTLQNSKFEAINFKTPAENLLASP